MLTSALATAMAVVVMAGVVGRSGGEAKKDTETNSAAPSTLRPAPEGPAADSRPKVSRNPRLATLKQPLRLRFERGIGPGALAFSPDSQTLAYCLNYQESGEPWIVLCEAATGKEVRRFRGHKYRWGYAAAFSPDGKRLLLGEENGSLYLWDIRTGKQLHQLAGGLIRCYGPFAFSPDGKLLAGKLSSTNVYRDSELEGSIHLWDVATGKELRHFGWKPYGPVRTFGFSDDGKFLVAEHELLIRATGSPVSGNLDVETRLSAHLWEVATGRHRGPVGFSTEWHSNGYMDCPCGRKLHEVGAQPGGFRVRISPSGTILLFPRRRRHFSEEWFQANSKALGSEFSNAWALNQFLYFEDRHQPHLTLSPDERWLATKNTAPNRGSELQIWDLSRLAHRPDVAPPRRSPKAWDALWAALDDRPPPAPPQKWLSLPASARLFLPEKPELTAFRAMRALAQTPEATVAFLKKRVRPVPRVRTPITRLLADLDDDRFAVRERAQRELIDRADESLPVLRRELERPPASLEMRRRMERIVQQIQAWGDPPAQTLRLLWAIELLEQLGTPEARQLLKEVAQGDPAAWVTREAKASLRRLASRGGCAKDRLGN